MNYIDELLQILKDEDMPESHSTKPMRDDDCIRQKSLSQFISDHADYFDKNPNDSPKAIT